jgi:23S rRNA (guanosine2251-2'-O)-methyltransferase
VSAGDPAWIVGFHAVLGALEAGRPVELVWLQRGRRDRRTRQVFNAARSRGVIVRQVDRRQLDEVAGDVPHNGCAARGAPVALREIGELAALDGPARVVLLDDIDDPHNVGAVIRSAAAFAIDGVIIAGPSAPPLGGALAKAAAGCLDQVPLVRAKVAADVLTVLCDAGFWAIGADVGGTLLPDVTPTDRWVLCLGAEEKGLRAKTRSRIDEMVAIPMAGEVESLNVSVAAGVLLYALTRET